MMVLRIVSGVVFVVIAVITSQMLIQRDVMSHMFVMNPIKVILVFVFKLCRSSTYKEHMY